MTQKGTWAKKLTIDAQYPTCELCGNVMRKPCTIAAQFPEGPRGFMVCPRCYGVWVCLDQMAKCDLIGRVDNGPREAGTEPQ